eukprot:3944542-Prymnesium_polylepis.1
MMSSPVKFLEILATLPQKVVDGELPDSNFNNLQGLLKLEHFDVQIQRKKSNAAAGLTDFIINLNRYHNEGEEHRLD